jgi:predicted TIM-barrel fold metal-dependent hydrolase
MGCRCRRCLSDDRYPLGQDDDPGLAIAYARATTTGSGFASPRRPHLPIAHIPLYDVDLAVEELRRCLKLGFRGMFLPPEPVCGKRPSHPDFDPLWQLMVDADLPVCVHLIVRFDRAVNLSGTRWWDPAKVPGNSVFSFALVGTLQLIPAVAALVCTAVRPFPTLKVAIVNR